MSKTDIIILIGAAMLIGGLTEATAIWPNFVHVFAGISATLAAVVALIKRR